MRAQALAGPIFVPIMLLLASSGVLLLSLSSWGNDEPVRLPIDLREGVVVRSTPFKVDFAKPYEVGLEVQRTLPFGRTVCLLDVDADINGDCKAIGSTVSLTWKIIEQGKLIASGASLPGQSGAYGQTITRIMGRVELQRGRTYTLEVRSLSDASALSPTRPKITLALEAPAVETEVVKHALAMLGSFILATVGAVWLLISTLKHYWPRRAKPASPSA